LIVELPGVTDVHEAIAMIGETPILEFKEENNIPPRDYQIVMKPINGLGFSEMGVIPNLGTGIVVEGKTYAPFEMSLFKLMLLVLGLDENNNEITETHKDYAVFNEFRALIAESENNPWSPDNFQKDFFMQYHIAEILKQDPQMRDQAEALCKHVGGGLLKGYQQMVNGSVYRGDGTRLESEGDFDLKQYLPGPDQTLAYCFTNLIRHLWYFSHDPKTLISSLDLDQFLPKIIAKALPVNQIFLRTKYKALKKHSFDTPDGKVHVSFMDMWHKILQKVKERTEETDFVSFDDHGWVMTFDPRVLAKQETEEVYDKPFLRQLGIAGIESWMGSEIKPWYMF